MSRLTTDKPISLVLGAGGVRGLAHLGVLEALIERGFRISEMTGTSVGALIIAFYAAAGLSLPEIKRLWLGLTTRNLLAWSLYRRTAKRMPEALRQRLERRAGIIPEFIRHLSEPSGRILHHGVERIGMVCYDLIRREEIFFHNLDPDFVLEEAARGSAAIPGFFPSRRCEIGGRKLRLVDGGITNPLPLDKLFAAPFAPQQIVVVDISNEQQRRNEHRQKIERLRQQYDSIPIEIITPDTLGKGTVIYRQQDLQALIDSGRQKTEEIWPH